MMNTNNLVAIKVEEIPDAVELGRKARRAVMLWGPPGVGKTWGVHEAAQRMGIEFRETQALITQPVDYMGVPFVEEDGEDGARVTRWAQPDMLPTKGDGIWFFDELPMAPMMVQNVLTKIVLEGVCGNWRAPAGWSFVAAGNRESDKAGTFRMSKPLEGRFIHFNVEADLESWRRWAVMYGIHPAVVAFMDWKREYFYQFDPRSPERAWPCPRSHHILSDMLKAGVKKNLRIPAFSGISGQKMAIEFSAWLGIYEGLPNLEDIEKNPTAVVFDRDDPGVCFALCAALAQRATNSKMPNVIRFIQRMKPEFQVVYFTTVKTAHPEALHCEAFAQWAANHSNVML